mgnify:CR=1 FL=1
MSVPLLTRWIDALKQSTHRVAFMGDMIVENDHRRYNGYLVVNNVKLKVADDQIRVPNSISIAVDEDAIYQLDQWLDLPNTGAEIDDEMRRAKVKIAIDDNHLVIALQPERD